MQKPLIILVGIIFLGVGCFMFFKNSNLQKVCTEETEATVVDIKEEMNTDENGLSYMYYPVIEYDANGEKIRVTMSSGSSTPQYNKNDKVSVLYNPNNVNEYIVKGEKTTGIMSIVFMVLGVLVTGYGIFVLIKKD